MTRQAALVPTVVSIVLGAGLWLALVPHDDTRTTNPRVAAYWWVVIAVAFALGLAFRRRRTVLIAFGLALPQFVLAFWTAPRGDGDGLWVLWMPLLLVLGVVLMLPAWAGGWLGQRTFGTEGRS